MDRCFADKGDVCMALKEKDCYMCPFYKTEEQKRKDDKKSQERLKNMRLSPAILKEVKKYMRGFEDE